MKEDSRELGCDSVDRIQTVQNKALVTCFYEYGNEPSSSIKGG
jgi:hypothetical protein